MSEITAYVQGKPRPQGSKSLGRGGHMYDAAKGLQPWRKAVAEGVADAAPMCGWEWTEEEVAVTCRFIFKRPKKPSRSFPPRNDTDKLLRAVLDAITQSGVIWKDDDQATSVWGEKMFGDEDGVWILIARREVR
jgi:Holliday junction resolvase RusA-like endonuclease